MWFWEARRGPEWCVCCSSSVPSSEVTYSMVAADLLHSLLAISAEPCVLKIQSFFELDENSYPLQQEFSLLDFCPDSWTMWSPGLSLRSEEDTGSISRKEWWNNLSFEDLFIFYVCEFCLCISVYHVWCPQRPGEGTRSPGTRVIYGCELPNGFWESVLNCWATHPYDLCFEINEMTGLLPGVFKINILLP